MQGGAQSGLKAVALLSSPGAPAAMLCLLRAQALQHVMQGSGPAFLPYLDDSLLQLIYRCVTHPNRFVRCALRGGARGAA